MPQIASRALWLCLIALCTGCTSLGETRLPAWTDKYSLNMHLGMLSESECLAHDGIWSGVEGAELALCKQRITDIGQPCTDHAQCQGICQTSHTIKPGKRAEGQCSAYPGLGCTQGVSRGRAEAILCACE